MVYMNFYMAKAVQILYTIYYWYIGTGIDPYNYNVLYGFNCIYILLFNFKKVFKKDIIKKFV